MANARRRRYRGPLATGALPQYFHRHSKRLDNSLSDQSNYYQPDYRLADGPRRRSRPAARPRRPALQYPLLEVWADPSV